MNSPVHEKDQVIAKLDTARQALAEAKRLQSTSRTKQIFDMAAAAEVYSKRQKLGEESIAYRE